MTTSNNYIGFLFLIFFTLGCNAQEKDTKDLSIIFKEYKKSNSLKSRKDFFYAFPNSFSSFQKIYGYDDTKGAAPYYGVAREHVSLFFKTAEVIDKKTFSQKLLIISRNGKWDADAVNYFQEGLRSYFFNHKEFLSLLSTSDKNQVYGFWYFFSDGPHFNDDVSKRVLNILKNNPTMRTSYLNAIKQVKKDNIH
jgi:hypothetical protein